MARPQNDPEHVFVTALPPETDYLSYLTIVEANLDEASLPLLNSILQDERLTANIGWDLVHLLTPLLPESSECLRTVARLGNPREVVLKVNEMLEIIGYDSAAVDESSLSSGDEAVDGGNISDAEARTHKFRSQQSSVLALRFKHMVRMIGILHPRIKTKRPSKFLLTIAEAVINAYKHLRPQIVLQGVEIGPTENHARQHNENIADSLDGPSATDAIITLLVDLSAVFKPPLPPRSGSTPSVTLAYKATVASDPEAEAIDPSEGALQRRVLICIATQISETLNAYIRECLPTEYVSWTDRYTRNKGVAKVMRHSSLDTDPGVEALSRSAQAATRRLAATLRSNLGLSPGELAHIIKGPGQYELNDLSVEDVKISNRGALFLLASSAFDGEKVDSMTPADHRFIVAKYLAGSSSLDFDPSSLAMVDALLFLGWLAMDAKAQPWDLKYAAGETGEQAQETYNEHLQQISVISANAPFPGLRYQAHLFVTTVLRQTMDSGLKYGFIRDTLEFCPFPNLKVTAVGWMKDEILAASAGTRREGATTGMLVNEQNVFLRPETLEDVAVSLFDGSDAEDGDEAAMAVMLPFWLAALNLLYVICSNQHIRETLHVAELAGKYDLKRRFVDMLDTMARQMLDGSSHGGGTVQRGMGNDGELLSDAVSRAKDGISKLEA